MICTAVKFQGILLHVRRTWSGKSAINAFLGGLRIWKHLRLRVALEGTNSAAIVVYMMYHTMYKSMSFRHMRDTDTIAIKGSIRGGQTLLQL